LPSPCCPLAAFSRCLLSSLAVAILTPSAFPFPAKLGAGC
jgi:hypothetical protein